MTTSLDAEMSWISLEDSQKPKLCPQCHHPMSVKQINFTEACRTCFNPECSSSADIEYIRRSYRHMESETNEIQDLREPAESFDEEMQRVNLLMNQVETLVTHRLSEELKNKLSNCEKQLEDLKPASLKKPVNCDESEKLCKGISTDLRLSQSSCTNVQAQPSTISSCVSSQSAGSVSQLEENAPPWYEATLGSRNEICDSINNLISSHDVLPESGPFDSNGEVFPLSPSAHDDPPNNTWQCDDDFWQNDSGVDSKASLPPSNGEAIAPGGCLNDESKMDESGEEKPCENVSTIPPKSVDTSCSGISSDRDVNDCRKTDEASGKKLESVQDLDLSVKKPSSFRCYLPRRRKRVCLQGTPAKIPVDESNLQGIDCVTSELGTSDSFLLDESSKESDVQLFPTPSASPDSCQSLPERFEHLSPPPFSQASGEFSVNVAELTQPLTPLLIQVKLGDDGQVILIKDEVKSTDNKRGSLTNCTLSNIVTKREKVESAPKKTPSTRATKAAAVKVKTSPKKGAGSKSSLGFSELRQFGGAKCSATDGRRRGGRVVGKGRQKVKSVEKVTSTAVHDDIERAITNLQLSSESQPPPSWDTSWLSDILS